MGRAPVRVGVDTGGTFTDLVAVCGSEVRIAKVLSTPQNPARAVLEGLAQLVPVGVPASLTYSTTVATNALLERRGARVLLYTTEGFEDVLEIGRQARPDLYALEPRRPAALVETRSRLGVRERMTFEGRALVALSASSVQKAVALARRRRPESIAVCFLHSYINPAHERRLTRALRQAGFLCTASHEISPRHREYERFSTAAINAYVAPKMSRHIGELSARLRGSAFRVMQSNGGAIDARTAAREAARTILSGPAAGVVGAQTMARQAGFPRIITFDMGGTSTDVCLVDGEVRRHAECSVGGLPINVAAIDVHTVGAGGGSLAYRDAGGVLKVGPESAGADPGPACYGRGTAPTVTDANLVLGRLGAGVLAGGLQLDRARAEKAVGALSRALRLPLDQTALGIIRIANAAMERAVRTVSVERGHDPRDYALVAFGGAAGLHACELAEGLGITHVLLPRLPGVLSAWGAASADVVREYVQTLRAVSPPVATLRRAAALLARQAKSDMRAERVRSADLRLEAHVGVRYAGQSFEVEVPLDDRYAASFHAAHQRLYGHADRARAVEVVFVGLRASASQGGAALPRRSARSPGRGAVRNGRVRTEGGWSRARIVHRDALSTAASARGPIIIEELSATTYLPPGWSAAVGPHGHLVLRHAR